MPIRFRCGHCSQLMGIARRKAGTTVYCPACRSPVIVPLPEDEASPPLQAAQPVGDAAAPLFERSDFEAFLDNPQPEPSPVAHPKPAPMPVSPAQALYPSDPLSSPSLALTSGPGRTRSAGLVLSPSQATWLTVVVILLVALAFGAGLLVGHYLMGS
jgi:hypothetical protein